MEAYYQQQSVSPYFAGHYRQRGSGFGALAAGIGRAAIPIAKIFCGLLLKRLEENCLYRQHQRLLTLLPKRRVLKKHSNQLFRKQ